MIKTEEFLFFFSSPSQINFSYFVCFLFDDVFCLIRNYQMGNENRAKSKSEPKNDLTTTSNILIREENMDLQQSL